MKNFNRKAIYVVKFFRIFANPLEVIVFNKRMQGFPPLKTITIKIEPPFGPTPTCSRKSFSRLIGHITDCIP